MVLGLPFPRHQSCYHSSLEEVDELMSFDMLRSLHLGKHLSGNHKVENSIKKRKQKQTYCKILGKNKILCKGIENAHCTI